MARKPGASIAYAYAADPEVGSPLPRQLVRRLTRRAKTVVSIGVLVCLYFVLSDRPTRPFSVVRQNTGKGGVNGDIWSEHQDDPEPGWGWSPFRPERKPAKTVPTDTPLTQMKSYIAPQHPDLTLLPAPEELFSEISLPKSLRPPNENPFPDTRLREIIDPNPPRDQDQAIEWALDPYSFNAKWKPPTDWKGPRGEMRRVQWPGFAGGRDRWESEKQKKAREQRRDAVKRGFAYAWQGYKDHAWGHDEVKPVSKTPSDPFNNWGATIIDSLDTLLIMGLSDEYNLCRRHVNQLDFHLVNGRNWEYGYTSEAPATDDDETPSETWTIQRDYGANLAVFETCIRYLGGLLGGYDLSGDKLLLERAEELAGILAKAFNTESGVPAGRMDPGAQPPVYRLNQISIAEAGSMSLEFMRLSQITNNRTWFDYAQRTMDFLNEKVIPRTSHSPLIPLYIAPDYAAETETISGTFAFGGLADSYYEYLIKTYKLLGASPVSQVWRKVYEASIDKAKKVLYVDIGLIPNTPILAIGKLEGGSRLIPEIEHLTCFAGAMLGLGAKLLNREQDMVDAERFTQSCYWLSAATATGLQPEVVQFYDENDYDYAWHEVDVDGHERHPHVSEAASHNSHLDRDGVLRWNSDGKPVHLEDGAKDESKETYERRLKGRPPGSVRITGRGLNRPETIESIFYMYRLTGDRKWQEKGWKMYVSWVTSAKVAAGVSSIDDVTRDLDKIRFSDNMESFAFAETFKYHYLLQSEPDLISLDDYVLNTEAHPLIANPDMKPGSDRFWNPPSDPQAGLGVRGQGTDAQKWKRLERIQNIRAPSQPPGGTGAGRGMGGGYGDPNHKPQPPPGAFDRPKPA